MTKKTRYFMAGSAAVMAAGLATGLVAYYAGGFQAVSASAVSTELRYVPADATMVAYADVRAIMDSDLRARLKHAMPMQEKGQQEFQAETGIDIERDIDYVVAALAPGLNQGAPLVVARGRFDSVRLEGLAIQHGGAMEEYKGKRMVVMTKSVEADPGRNHHIGNMVLAFLEPGLVAIGDLSAVKNAIDAQFSAHSITSNNEMMELVTDMGAYNNAWAVGRFDVIASQAKLPNEVMSRMPPVKWFAAAGHINGGLSGTLRAEATDEKSGEELRAVVNGFLAAGRLAAQNDPTAGGLVNSLQLSGSGKSVSLSFTIPGELLNMIPRVAGQ
jgi:hypothetical protein